MILNAAGPSLGAKFAAMGVFVSDGSPATAELQWLSKGSIVAGRMS